MHRLHKTTAWNCSAWATNSTYRHEQLFALEHLDKRGASNLQRAAHLRSGGVSDSYRQVPFWGLLDYVGINAYFPLSTAQTPSVAELVTGWSSYNVGTVRNWTQEIETLQATVNKPVIFTEIGYQSIDYAAKNPSNDYVEPYNGLGQANCYEAALRVFANKPWFAGIFWWGWSPENAGGAGNTYYTPQNKPAQSVLTAHWLPNFELIPSAPA